MACGHQSEMDIESASHEAAAKLAQELGQFTLDSSPVLTAKTPKFTRKYSLRELEIQQTIGKLLKRINSRAHNTHTHANNKKRERWGYKALLVSSGY